MEIMVSFLIETVFQRGADAFVICFLEVAAAADGAVELYCVMLTRVDPIYIL